MTEPGPILLDAMESDLPAELFTAKNCVAVHSDEELIKALEDAGAADRKHPERRRGRDPLYCIAEIPGKRTAFVRDKLSSDGRLCR